MRKISVALIILFLVLLVTQTPGKASATSNFSLPQSEAITEGVGISGIIVGRSTMSDVTATYGSGFKLVEHNKYSYEAKYKDLGLSFYYCYNDEEKKIFAIHINPPCHGVTSKGVIVGYSTLQDVFDLYGKAKPFTTAVEETWFFEYLGIGFHIEFDPKLKGNGDEIPEEILKKKIISIEVEVPDLPGSACRGGI